MNKERQVFEFEDYRQLIKNRVGPEGTRTGIRLAIAKKITCHPSYLTKVLDGRAHLSLDQAFKLAQFFKFSRDESEYLLLLVEKARAGTKDLENYFILKIAESRKKHLQLKERVPIRNSLKQEDQATYYSSWRYAAIHMALTVSDLQTRSALSNYFGISEYAVADTLKFLVGVGLAVEKDQVFSTGETQLHLGGDSPNILKHHTNWKIQALVALDGSGQNDLHYSGVVTLSQKDAEKLREQLISSLQQSLSFITQAKEEEAVFCMSLDFFHLGRT